LLCAVLIGTAATPAGAGGAQAGMLFEIQSLDGSGNNRLHTEWGEAQTNYQRIAPANYADGRSAPVDGPDSRYVSNRIFNDAKGEGDNQNIFSESQVNQWGWVWGQFVDHTIGLAQGRGPGDPTGEPANIPLDTTDPLEEFRTPAEIPFTRSAPAAGTGTTNPREQVNTVSSYLDASAVYGDTDERLEWLREGPVDGDVSNNGAKLLLPDGYLPRRDARGDAGQAPATDISGRLLADPNSAVVAGDVRPNNNISITAVQTLFAREHNRIVDQLPDTLSEESKFQIARRTVIAEMQYITYNEFLPAMGVNLPAYRGYNRHVNATISNEFAATGFRVHSMIHDSIILEAEASRYTQAQLDVFRSRGIVSTVSPDGERIQLTVRLAATQSSPALVPALQLGPLLRGIGLKTQYANDEQLEGQLRSAFLPVGTPGCAQGPGRPACLFDLGTLDLERSRDHGMPTYNDMRRAYGLPPRTSFAAITGEPDGTFPSDPLLTAGDEVNDPDSIDYVQLVDRFGSALTLDSPESQTDAVLGVRRTPLAARLGAVYGSVDNLDAFTGMFSEPRLPGSQLGQLLHAIWAAEFQRLRDGDRFFYGNQLATLNHIKNAYHVDYRRNLGDIIAANTDIPRAQLPTNVFFLHGQVPPTNCKATYTITGQTGTDAGTFTATVTVTNTGNRPLDGWTLRFRYLHGQVITETRNGVAAQNNSNVPITNAAANATIAPGQTRVIGITATWTNHNAKPTTFTLNTTGCRSL
jgi:hypothetical protein